MTPRDAFRLPLVACEAGIPFLAMKLLAEVAAAGNPELEARVRAQADVLAAQDVRVARQLAEVQELLARNGVAVPPPPADLAAYLRWNDTVVGALDGPLAALGRTAGEAIQTLTLQIITAHLAVAAPTALEAHEQALAERARAAMAAFVAILPALPEEVRPRGEQMLATTRVAVTLGGKTDGAARVAGLKLLAGKLVALAEAVRASLPG